MNLFEQAIYTFETQTLFAYDLAGRKAQYRSFFDQEWGLWKLRAGEINLNSGDGFAQSEELSDWVDRWVGFSWNFARNEQLLIQDSLASESQSKATFLVNDLPQKKKKKDDLEELLFLKDGSRTAMDEGEYDYYLKTYRSLEEEIRSGEIDLHRIEEALPSLLEQKTKDLRFERFFCLIARGGFGRKELTYSSDIDIAYLVDIRNRTSFELIVLHELIRRLEELFTELPLDFASQYFELGEDLSRFHEVNALHTFPAIFEARAVLGAPKLLKQFKREAESACPKEKLIRFLRGEINKLTPNSLETFHIKQGEGGLRHFQSVLWIWVVLMKSTDNTTKGLIGSLVKKKWISEVEAEQLVQAVEFFLDLRNFIGLFEVFKPALLQMGEERIVREGVVLDRYDGRVALGLLKLKSRFTTIDQWDRFRLHCTRQIKTICQKVIEKMLNRMVEVHLNGFKLVKHLGSNQIQKVLFQNEHVHWIKDHQLTMFLDWENLFELFVYLANNGNDLSDQIQVQLAELLPRQLENQNQMPRGAVKSFIYQLYTGDYASSAVRQMIEIALPLSKGGEAQTLLGIFLPQVNQMRFLLRNLEVHQHPLCEHSIRALSQIEIEIIRFKSDYPELWGFLKPEDLFTLKFATFFHDIGKINPYKHHEEHGPKVVSKMLDQLGFIASGDQLDHIRMLVAHHQSMVRFSKLSTHLDLGILKFFELAGRDPRMLILLYLVNISDFKSVSDRLAENAGFLDEFFERTLGILEAFRQHDNDKTLTQTINEHLDQKVEEKIEAVVLDMLLWQSCTVSLEEALLQPLKDLDPELALSLAPLNSELNSLVHFLSLGELDKKSLEKHYLRFFNALRSALPKNIRFKLAENYVSDWDWFFTVMPNRYLLSADPQSLSQQLIVFDDCLENAPRFSFVKGMKGEYDNLLFYAKDDPSLQARLAYLLNSKGINIELGKINQIKYLDGSFGFAGYFQGAGNADKDVSTNEIEKTLEELVLPDLGHPSWNAKPVTHCQVQYLYEREKGYIVAETLPGRYERSMVECWAVKVSTYDSPYGYFKIMAAIESLGVHPLQVLVTTIGNQLIDHFYVTAQDKEKLVTGGFETLLNRFLASKIQA